MPQSKQKDFDATIHSFLITSLQTRGPNRLKSLSLLRNGWSLKFDFNVNSHEHQWTESTKSNFLFVVLHEAWKFNLLQILFTFYIMARSFSLFMTIGCKQMKVMLKINMLFVTWQIQLSVCIVWWIFYFQGDAMYEDL